MSQSIANNIIRDITRDSSLLSVYLEHMRDIYPEWGLVTVIVIMIVIIDNDGSLDILHHPGPGERPVSGLEERAGECCAAV